MDSIMNKTQLAEKQYKGKLKKDKRKESRLNTNKHRKRIKKKLKKVHKIVKSTIVKYRKQKSQQNYKRKNNMNQIKEEF